MERAVNNNIESKARKIIFNEVSFAIAVIGITISAILWIRNPQTSNELAVNQLQIQFENNQKMIDALNKIRDNDIHTIQQNVKDLQTKMTEVEKSQTQIITILEERLPKKKYEQ